VIEIKCAMCGRPAARWEEPPDALLCGDCERKATMDAKTAFNGAQRDTQQVLADSALCLYRFAAQADHDVMAAAGIIGHCLREGGRVFICGNGGSAAQAQHMAAELVGRFRLDGRAALPAMALTTDTSALTAIGNDWSFADIFSRQVEAWNLGKTDVLIALSASGNSPNVVKALATARSATARTIAMTGNGGGAMRDLAECWIEAPTGSASDAQLCHLAAIHAICGLVEEGL